MTLRRKIQTDYEIRAYHRRMVALKGKQILELKEQLRLSLEYRGLKKSSSAKLSS